MTCSVCNQLDGRVYVVGTVETVLCAECVGGAEGSITRWISERMRQVACEERAAHRRMVPSRLAVAMSIIERDGYVTSKSFCAATGARRRSAYNALWLLERAGRLESDTFYGGEVRFFVAEQRVEAAE